MLTVSTSAELKQALQSLAATGGVIALEPGAYSLFLDARYGEPWSRFDAPVTIMSASAADPATFTDVRLIGSRNVSFDNLRFDYAGPKNVTADPVVLLENVSNVTITDSVFTGALGENFSPIADGYPIGVGLDVRRSNNVTVSESHFESFFRAAIFDYSDQIKVFDNTVTKMRSDGFVLSAVRDVLIEGNHLYDFRPSPESPDHQDMIQLFSIHRDVPSRDIVIRDNFLQSGTDQATQTIFMRNEAYDLGQLPPETAWYRNILIEDNVIFNGHQWGINVGETDGLTIRNNTLLHNPVGGSQPPLIAAAAAAKNVAITDNIVSALYQPQSHWDTSGNVLVQNTDYFGYNYYNDLFVNALGGGLVTEEELRLLPGTGVSAGAARTVFDPTPDALTALFTADLVNAIDGVYRLTADLTADANGFVGEDEAVFSWRLPDGSVGTGMTIEHEFGRPGRYEVELTVTMADGRKDVLATQVRVVDPSILHLTGQDGVLRDISSYDVGFTVSYGPVEFAEGRDGSEAFVLGDGVRILVNHTSIPRAFSLPEMSMSFGFKARNGAPSDDGTLMNLLDSYNAYLDSAGELAFTLYTNAGRFDLRTRGAGLADGEWHDVTVVYDDAVDRLSIYVDDGLAASGFATGTTTSRTSKSLYLGDTWKPSAEVVMDRFEMWNYALGESDVAALHDVAAATPGAGEGAPPETAPETGPETQPETQPETGPGEADAIGEVGVIAAADHAEIRVAFSEQLTAPVVFAQVNTFNGAQAVIARVTEVDATGFTLALEEPDGYDQFHVPETVSWLAVEAGDWRLADGTLLKAGAVTSGAMAAAGGVDVALGDGFSEAPAVLSQLQTRETGRFAYTRQIDATADEAVLGIEFAEAGAGDAALPETVGWMAVERGAGAWASTEDAFEFSAGEVATLDHTFRRLDFDVAFDAAPAFFGAVASIDGPDPVTLRGGGLDAYGAMVALEEDVTLDSETWHVPETMHWLAVGGAGLLYADVA